MKPTTVLKNKTVHVVLARISDVPDMEWQWVGTRACVESAAELSAEYSISGWETVIVSKNIGVEQVGTVVQVPRMMVPCHGT